MRRGMARGPVIMGVSCKQRSQTHLRPIADERSPPMYSETP